ncbi:unnamed protein product [Victoria cruziana]
MAAVSALFGELEFYVAAVLLFFPYLLVIAVEFGRTSQAGELEADVCFPSSYGWAGEEDDGYPTDPFRSYHPRGHVLSG